MKKHRTFGLLLVCFLLAAAAIAYSNGVHDSLLRSRDQVADQRQQLERAYSEVDKKINQLQDQKYSISRYLQECDKTMRDLDKALSAQQSAYRGR